MLHASALISRMIKSVAQSAPVAAVKLDATARRVPSALSLSPLPCAALRVRPSRRLPRSPCNNAPDDTGLELLATSGGKSWHCGRPPYRQPLGEFGDTTQSKSSAFSPSSARMTTVHLTPAPERRLPPASQRGQAVPLLFFEPRGDGVTRHSEGARQATQTAAFVVGAKYLLALFGRVSVAARLLSAALSTIAAKVALAAIGSQTVPHQMFALAMLASEGNSNHCWTLPCHLYLSHYQIKKHFLSNLFHTCADSFYTLSPAYS